MKKKRYPPEMFFVGLFMSLIRTLYVPVVALILLLLHFILPQYIPALAALLVFLLWPVYAVVDQLNIRRKIMSSEEYEFVTMTDPDKADSWQEELRRQAREKIDAGLRPAAPEDDGRSEDPEEQGEDSEEEP